MPFQYPSTDAADRLKLLSLLGSFWSNFYGGREQLLTMLSSLSLLQSSQYALLNQTADTLDRQRMPVLRKSEWSVLHLSVSDGVANGKPIRYSDSDLTFGGTATRLWNFGEYRVNYTSYPLPAGLVGVTAICNRLTDSSVIWVNGVDFILDTVEGVIHFLDDPGQNELFAKDQIITDGEADTSVTLWLFQPEFDDRRLFRQLGYVLKLDGPSGLPYRDFLNSVADAVTGGSSLRDIQNLIEAVTRAPFAKSGEEFVASEVVNGVLLLITNQRVCRLPLDATITAGDWLENQALTDIADIVELNNGETPEWLPALTLGSEFLAAEIPSTLTFVNQTLNTTITENDDGVTLIRFPISGNADAVAKFWELVDAAGVQHGKTLAQCLDTRTSSTTQPTAGYLPATINPLEFVVKYVLRNNTWLLHLKQSAAATWLPVSWSQALRQILPPHTAVIIYAELVELSDYGIVPTGDIIDGSDMLDATLADYRIGLFDELLRPITVAGR